MIERIIIILVLLAILRIQVTKSNENKGFNDTFKTAVEKIVARKGDDIENICKFRKCIPKCCPAGKFLLGTSKKCKAKENNKDFSEVPLYNRDQQKTGRCLTDVYALVPGKFVNEPAFYDNSYDYSAFSHRFFLTEDGILLEEQPNIWDRWLEHNTSNFCVDYMKRRKSVNFEYRFYSVHQEEPPTVDDPIISAGLLVSCFFLALVLLVYALLRELRNLSGMVLMAYIASLFGAFLLLAIIQQVQLDADHCKILTFTTYFFFLASFCWMNIMSCDIWWTFRGYAKARPIHRRGECFKFCMYCIYAWGLPAALTTLVVILNELDLKHMPWIVTPHIPFRGCFFPPDEKLIFLYTPMLILILSNWIFFLMTAFNIWRLHRATAVLDSAAAGTPAAHRSQKYRFLVYLKLSVIMGINWVLEVVSSTSPNFKGWYITDLYNMLIGVSIFLIFIFKKKILGMLIKRLSGFGRWKKSYPFSRSQSRSTTTASDSLSNDVPCGNPKGAVFLDKP